MSGKTHLRNIKGTKLKRNADGSIETIDPYVMLRNRRQWMRGQTILKGLTMLNIVVILEKTFYGNH